MAMSPELITNFKFNVGFVKLLADQTPEANYHAAPAEGIHPIAWQLGHVVYSLAGAAGLLGFTVALPADFKEKYGMGSTPSADPAHHGDKADMIEKLEVAAAAVIDAAGQVGPDHLAQPNPMDELRDVGLPTLGDLVAFLMTGHLMMHAGQIASGRRVQGLPSVL
jgi:hypothetical protein